MEMTSDTHVFGYDPYTAHGYEDREHYLQCLAEDWMLPLHIVESMAHLLGPEEDFDGLLSALEDVDNGMSGVW
jgi:hypothetical protein